MVTHVLLRDLIPQKRLIWKVLQTFMPRFTQKVDKEVKLPLTQFEEHRSVKHGTIGYGT